MIQDFDQCNANSDLDNDFYFLAFFLCERVETIKYEGDGIKDQKSGIDKRIYLKGGRVITVEEKKRNRKYEGDIALEIWSDIKSRKPGWLYTCTAEFIRYNIDGRDFLIETIYLKAAWSNNKDRWLQNFRPKSVSQRGNILWESECCCVTATELSYYMEHERYNTLNSSAVYFY